MLELTRFFLFRFTAYNVIVQAYNSRGAGPTSEPVTVRTMEDGELSTLFTFFFLT